MDRSFPKEKYDVILLEVANFTLKVSSYETPNTQLELLSHSESLSGMSTSPWSLYWLSTGSALSSLGIPLAMFLDLTYGMYLILHNSAEIYQPLLPLFIEYKLLDKTDYTTLIYIICKVKVLGT